MKILLLSLGLLGFSIASAVAEEVDPSPIASGSISKFGIGLLSVIVGAVATEAVGIIFRDVRLKKQMHIPPTMTALFIDPNAPNAGWCSERVTFEKRWGRYHFKGYSNNEMIYSGVASLIGKSSLGGNWKSEKTEEVSAFFLERDRKGRVLYGFFSTSGIGGQRKACGWALGESDDDLDKARKCLKKFLVKFPDENAQGVQSM